jgi:small subunit ribosomal protein S3
MGHKVNPLIYRTPYLKSWKSIWFEDKKSYKDSLALDLKVRQILKKELRDQPL